MKSKLLSMIVALCVLLSCVTIPAQAAGLTLHASASDGYLTESVSAWMYNLDGNTTTSASAGIGGKAVGDAYTLYETSTGNPKRGGFFNGNSKAIPNAYKTQYVVYTYNFYGASNVMLETRKNQNLNIYTTVDGDFEANRWNNFTFVYDTEHKQISVYVNGVAKVTDKTVGANYAPVFGGGNIRMTLVDRQEGLYYYVDDLAAYASATAPTIAMPTLSAGTNYTVAGNAVTLTGAATVADLAQPGATVRAYKDSTLATALESTATLSNGNYVVVEAPFNKASEASEGINLYNYYSVAVVEEGVVVPKVLAGDNYTVSDEYITLTNAQAQTVKVEDLTISDKTTVAAVDANDASVAASALLATADEVTVTSTVDATLSKTYKVAITPEILAGEGYTVSGSEILIANNANVKTFANTLNMTDKTTMSLKDSKSNDLYNDDFLIHNDKITVTSTVDSSLTNTYTVSETQLTSGTLPGDGIEWVLDTDTKTITFSGTGAMTGWDNEKYAYELPVKDETTKRRKTSVEVAYRPWHYNVSKIEKVVIGDGITSIGSNSFRAFTNLTEVVFPATSLTEIKDGAFALCTSLKTVVLPASVDIIGEGAFKQKNSSSKPVLESFTFLGNPSNIHDTLFDHQRGTLVIYTNSTNTNVLNMAKAKIYDYVLLDKDYEIVYDADTQIATARNFTNSPVDVAIIVASYGEGYLLDDVAYTTVTIPAAGKEGKKTLTFTGTHVPGGNVKAMLWDGFDTVTPLCPFAKVDFAAAAE